MICCARSSSRGLFCVSNVAALAILGVSVSFVLKAYKETGMQMQALAFLRTASPEVVASAVVAAAAVLYILGLFSVFCLSSGKNDNSLAPPIGPKGAEQERKRALQRGVEIPSGVSAAEAELSAKAPAAAASKAPVSQLEKHRAKDFSSIKPQFDADVVIAGGGCAGAALATILAREGKRVVVIERNMGYWERIVGELMQPGGIRVLERLGLDEAAKGAFARSIHVEGYACITPNTEVCKDLILTYPASDPATPKEYFGVFPEDTREIKRHQGHGNGNGSKDDVLAKRAVDDRSPEMASNKSPVSGIDIAPRGRSFHNHLFVHGLREAMLREPNVTLHIGNAKKLVSAADLRQGGKDMASQRSSFNPPPIFGGFGEMPADAHTSKEIPKPVILPSIQPDETFPKRDASELDQAVPSSQEWEDDRVMGVSWVDDNGKQRFTTAPITVVSDGNYSTLRPALSSSQPYIASYFCGLILNHPAYEPPLPYPNRGHVIMADPNPVLLYQISPTETRVLVDVPAPLPSVENGELKAYFTDKIAPQLPPVMREAFLTAVNTQEPDCAANRALVAQAPKREGAVLLGDSLNMRHPLTGGGMTVALKDVEMFYRAIREKDLQGMSSKEIQSCMEAFNTQRASHASTINILANALHRVFTKPNNDDGTRARLRAACIDYLSMGGPCTAGPIGLLSGLTPKPEVLVAHFFAVALHAMKMALLPLPTPTRLRQGYDLLHVACMIIMPLLQAEKVTVMGSSPVLAITNFLFPWKGMKL